MIQTRIGLYESDSGKICNQSKNLNHPVSKSSLHLGGKRVKTLSLQEPGSGQIQYTSWRNFAPFTTPIHKDIQASALALGTAGDRQWVRSK